MLIRSRRSNDSPHLSSQCTKSGEPAKALLYLSIQYLTPAAA